MSYSTPDVAEQVRSVERARIYALVERDVASARMLHSPEFLTVNPIGQVMNYEEYLGALASGDINYVSWKPGQISVRMLGDGAMVRHVSEQEIIIHGGPIVAARFWHIGIYEPNQESWQMVATQITEIY